MKLSLIMKITKQNKKMSTKLESKSVSTVPKWDRKVELGAMYLAQIIGLVEYHNCGDTMDGTIITNCPPKLEFDGLQPTTMDSDEKYR